MKDYEEVIKLDNEDFLIVSRLNYEGKEYLYVNSLVNESDYSILEEYEKDGRTVVKSIDDDKYELIMNLFTKNLINDNNWFLVILMLL